MMYGSNSEIVEYRARQLDTVAACPATAGPGSKLQRAALDRWVTVASALESTLTTGTDTDQAIEENTEWLDQIQTDVIAELVRNGIAILESPDVVYDFDPDPLDATVDNDAGDIRLVARNGVKATHPDGSIEYLKIRTGTHPTTRSEAAILLADAEPGHSYADALLATGVIEPIELEPTELDTELERLFDTATTPTNPRERRPGRDCYICHRIARCGQYPTVDGIDIGRWQRTILTTKTELLNLNQCHRRVAWKRLFAMPKDDPGEQTFAAARGTRFHDLLAEAIIDDDPDTRFEALLDRIDAANHDEMRALYENHKTIEANHTPVDYRRTEYQIGITLVVSGIEVNRDGSTRPDRPIAVTVIARADAVGREPDGTPAVIEHRTGANSDRINERETALYALSAARLLGTDTVAVHQHALEAKDGPRCERILYTPDRLEAAVDLLTTAVEPLAQWDPNDATKTAATPGEWCTTCDYRQRCPDSALRVTDV